MMDALKPGYPNCPPLYVPPVPPQRSLLRNISKYVIGMVIVLGITVLVLWILYRPHPLKVYVVSASLNEFNLTGGDDNNLQYDFNLSMSIRNPNRRMGIYYDDINPRAYYDDYLFAYTSVPQFYQGHRNTSTIYPVFEGAHPLPGDSAARTYVKEKGEGFFNVHIRFYTRLRAKVMFFKIRYTKTKIHCHLKLPAPGSSPASFAITECDWDLF